MGKNNMVSKTHTTLTFCKGRGFSLLSSLLSVCSFVYWNVSSHLLLTEARGQVSLKDCSAYIVLQLKMVLIISKSVYHILQHNAYKLEESKNKTKTKMCSAAWQLKIHRIIRFYVNVQRCTAISPQIQAIRACRVQKIRIVVTPCKVHSLSQPRVPRIKGE